MTNRLLTLAIGSLISGSAVAQGSGSPVRLRGRTDKVSGGNVRLALRNGAKASVELPPNRPDDVIRLPETKNAPVGKKIIYWSSRPRGILWQAPRDLP